MSRLLLGGSGDWFLMIPGEKIEFLVSKYTCNRALRTIMLQSAVSAVNTDGTVDKTSVVVSTADTKSDPRLKDHNGRVVETILNPSWNINTPMTIRSSKLDYAEERYIKDLEKLRDDETNSQEGKAACENAIKQIEHLKSNLSYEARLSEWHQFHYMQICWVGAYNESGRRFSDDFNAHSRCLQNDFNI